MSCTPLHGALLCLMAMSVAGTAQASCPEFLEQPMRKLHSADSVSLCELAADKAMLVVNTASHCGFTSQFSGLEALHQQYHDKGLVVLGFASDDFFQAADSEEEAASICYKNYGVTFTMLAPTAVRGKDANPVFQEIARQSSAPSWNFNKYVLDARGNVVAHFGSRTSPDSKALVGAIEGVLNK